MEIQERLAEAARLLKEREKLLKRRATIENKIQEQKANWLELKNRLGKEAKDVERLEGLTLQNFWHSLTGTKDIAQHKEQEEYLAAKMKFDGASAALENLQVDIRRIDNELDAVGDPQATYDQAVKDKENYLLRSGGPEAQQLFDVAEGLGSLQAEIKEAAEAIDAGQKAARSLSEVVKSLGSAQGWGVVDILGGGLITTAIKHSHIGTARNKINRAQQQLRSFQTELADVQTSIPSIEMGRIWTLADFILDGLLFDFIVQSQINQAQNRTRQLLKEIQSIIEELEQIQEKNRQTASELEQKRRQIIETI